MKTLRDPDFKLYDPRAICLLYCLIKSNFIRLYDRDEKN